MAARNQPQAAPAASERESPGAAAWLNKVIEADRRKWGGMTLGAHGRLGLAELREAVSLHSGTEAATPLGMWGTLTPGEIGAARNEGSPFGNLEEEPLQNQPSPGDIAHGRDVSVYGPSAGTEQVRGASVHGERQPDGPMPSPSDIARSQQPNTAAQPGRELGLEHGRER